MDGSCCNQTECFHSKNHAEKSLKKMETYLYKKSLCDVVLVAGQKRVHAHRLVLSAVSDYFSAMFTSDVREAQELEIELLQVDPDALATLVQYAYTGRVDLREDTVEALLSAACLLQVIEVRDACCAFLVKQLHPSNCLGIRLFAETHGCSQLFEQTDTFVKEHFTDVIRQQEFRLLPAKEVGRILESDALNVKSEEQVFHALVQWARHDVEARQPDLPRLLAAVRLPLLSPKFLADCVEAEPLLTDQPQSQQLVLEAYRFHLLRDRRPTALHSVRCRPRASTVGFLYAVGGMNSTKGTGTTSIERYEMRTDSWSTVSHMSSRRLQFGAACVDGRLYVVGGRDGLKTLGTVECYDTCKRCWVPVTPMATPRHGLGVEVLGGPLYAAGGHDGWSYLSSVERWDPSAKQWSYVAPMNSPRSTAGIAVLNAFLYVGGGRDGSSCLRTVERYDPHTNRWTYCSPLHKRRGGVALASCCGFLYAVGGHDAPVSNPGASRFDSVERYDPKTDSWTTVAGLSSPKDAVAACVLGRCIVAVGGYDGQSYLSDAESYDPQNNEWTKISNMTVGRAGSALVHVNSHFLSLDPYRQHQRSMAGSLESLATMVISSSPDSCGTLLKPKPC